MTDRQFARRIVIAIALASMFALLCYSATLLLLAFAGVLGAVISDTGAEWICKHTKLSRRVSYLVFLLGAIALVGVALWLLVPRVVVQLSELTEVLPKALKNARNYLDQYQWGRTITSHLGTAEFGALASKLTEIGSVLVNIAVAGTVMIVLTAYLGEDPAYYKQGVLILLPETWRPQADALFRDVANTLRWWLIGQSIPMIALGIATLAGLLALGIPLAFTLSLFTGVMIFIPFAGAIIAFIVTGLVTLSYNPSMLLEVAALFLGIHILEGYVLTPLVQKRAVYLPPALTIVSEVLMSTLFGFLGLILATPLAAAIRVVVEKLYIEPRQSGEGASVDTAPRHTSGFDGKVREKFDRPDAA